LKESCNVDDIKSLPAVWYMEQLVQYVVV